MLAPLLKNDENLVFAYVGGIVSQEYHEQVLNDAKWSTFDNTELLTSLDVEGFEIKDVRVKNPDNPANLIPAKLITYSLD